MTEQLYAARRQHSCTGEAAGNDISLDWMEAVWLLIDAISVGSPLV